MLNVGLIGLGPEWECRYRPALMKLRHRLRVRSVYTAVITHAEQVSAELDCDVAPGLVALMERDDVRALLVLDTAWFSGVPAKLACLAGKPAFLAGRLVHRVSVADQLLLRAAETGVTLMPDFGHRYTPATSRLRELIAARLGRPLTIVVDAGAPVNETDIHAPLPAAVRDVLAATLDWCTNLVGTAPGAVRARFSREGDPGTSIRLPQLRVEFRRPAAGGDAAVACIRLNESAGADAPEPGWGASSIDLCARVECVNGTVWLKDSRHVTWESAGEKVAESLATDRTDVEVMLDLFARRVAGGLIPIPTLEDLWPLQIVDVALDGLTAESRKKGGQFM